MKILHLLYDDIDNVWMGGGAPVRVYEVYRRLAKRHDITVATGNYPGAKQEEEKDGVKYRRIGSNRSYLLSRLTFSKGVPGIVRNMDYDILVEDFSAPFPYFTPAYTRRPVVALVQIIFSFLYFKKRPLLAGPTILLQKLGFMYYDNFIAVSNFVENKIRARNKSASICVIPNGIDADSLSCQSEEKDYILYLGRIECYDKGLDILIESFKNVVKKHPINLVIAGGGRAKEIEKLNDLIRNVNNIAMVGKVSGEVKKEYLANCLFLCIPSRSETFSVVALEAFSFGKPIIAANVGGLLEIVERSGAGLLVNSGSLDSLTSQMLKLLENDELRKELGNRGRKFAAGYTWESVAKRQEEYYKKVWSMDYEKRNG